MSNHYILDNHKPVPCDLMTWAESMGRIEERRVAETSVGKVRISTVFLGLDHSFGAGPPELFETMAFGHDTDEEYQTRCATWEQAEQQHAAMCALFSGSGSGSDAEVIDRNCWCLRGESNPYALSGTGF